MLRALETTGANFCEDFEADIQSMERYTEHSDYLHGLVVHALANNGATGAEKERLVVAREFVWNNWILTRKHFRCHIRMNPNDQHAKDARRVIKHLLIAPRNVHSVRCLMRMLIKRTTWRQVYLTE